jgi:quinol monooxygenase YgiN
MLQIHFCEQKSNQKKGHTMSISTIKLNILCLFKFKASLSLSLLAAFFLSFFLIGCGGGGSSDNGGKSVPPVTTIDAKIPTITSQPVSAIYAQGDIASPLSITAIANDEGTLSYQWYENNANSNNGGTLIQGATQRTYTPPTSTIGAVYYYVVVTNTNDKVSGEKIASITSNAAKIEVSAYPLPPTVNAKTPTITVQPVSAIYAQGDSVSPLSVTATVDDRGALSYQWYENNANSNNGGTPIQGATQRTYIPSTSDVEIVYYYVVVTNTNDKVSGEKIASITSNAAKIEVNALVNAQTPNIISQPQNATYAQGDYTLPLSITATVNDGGTLSYQWYRTTNPNDNINGILVGTSSTYTTYTSTIGTTYYYVVITNTNSNANGNQVASVVSSVIKVEVNERINAQTPDIVVQPVGATYTQGDYTLPLSITATVNDGGTLSYQWYGNGVLIPEATSSTYNPSVSTIGTTYYFVAVTNTNNNANGNQVASTESVLVWVEVNERINAQTPDIVVQPISATYAQGDNTSVSVIASVNDRGTLSYQWYENNVNSNNGGTPIPEATERIYYVPSTSEVGIIYYYVIVTNTNDKVNGEKIASITSNAAEIVVKNTNRISFYDKNLDLIETVAIKEGTIINPSNIKSGYWYKANDDRPLETHTLTDDIRLYATGDVQEITTQEWLASINTSNYTLAGKYILLNNITLNESKAGFDNQWWSPKGWIPIGNSSSPFRGIFNGNGNKITNLWIDRPDIDYIGLFGHVSNAQIKNLGVETAEEKDIKGRNYIGGIAGNITNGNITNSYFIGNISISAFSSDTRTYTYMGGIAGSVTNGDITNSYSIGNVNSNRNATGGNSYAYAYAYIGGIAGSVTNGNITNSYSIGNVSGNSSATSSKSAYAYAYIGGIVGNITKGSITNSYSIGNVSGNSNATSGYDYGHAYTYTYVGGIAGSVTNGDIANSYSIENVSGSSSSNGSVNSVYISNRAYTYVGGIAGSVTRGNITNSYSIGSISGNNNIISGYSNDDSVAYAYIGGITGNITNGNIIYSYSIGNASGSSSAANGYNNIRTYVYAYVGGIAGSATNGDIAYNYSLGNVSGNVNNSVFYSNTGAGAYVGGITGSVSGNITYNYFIGSVSGNADDSVSGDNSAFANVGGIAGSVYGNITYNYSIGNVNSNVSGGSSVDSTNVGGIAGSVYGNITYNYSIGNISNYKGKKGGIVGYVYGSTIQNNAAINPSITGDYNANRVIGRIGSSNTISNNFALDTMTINGNTVSNSDANGIGKTDEQFKAQTTYSNTISIYDVGGLGWRFGNDANHPWVWGAFEDYPYPTFYWQTQRP